MTRRASTSFRALQESNSSKTPETKKIDLLRVLGLPYEPLAASNPKLERFLYGQDIVACFSCPCDFVLEIVLGEIEDNQVVSAHRSFVGRYGCKEIYISEYREILVPRQNERGNILGVQEFLCQSSLWPVLNVSQTDFPILSIRMPSVCSNRRNSGRWSVVKRVEATPCSPARPVRPMRWMKVSATSGSS